MAQQADALARDAFAAGTALYTDEGRPAPIDDTTARVRQARIVADRTGLPVPPYSADEIADMRRILADGPPERRAALLAHYDALPDDMKAALETGSVPAEGVPTPPDVQTDAAPLIDMPNRPVGESPARWIDPNIVRVAGGDREKDKETRPPLPGAGARKGYRDDEMPPPRQINPLAIPGGGGGGFRFPRLSRPSPGASGTAAKPVQPAAPSSSGQEEKSSIRDGGGSAEPKTIEVNGKHLPRPGSQGPGDRQPVLLSSLDKARGEGMAGANYAQKTYQEAYNNAGRLKGWTIDDVADALRSGKLSPKDVYVDYVFLDGHWLMHNTRSPQALLRAGIPKDQWYVRDMTGTEVEGRVRNQLRRNKLSADGTPTVVSR